jgi:hypothetical protein
MDPPISLCRFTINEQGALSPGAIRGKSFLIFSTMQSEKNARFGLLMFLMSKFCPYCARGGVFFTLAVASSKNTEFFGERPDQVNI